MAIDNMQRFSAKGGHLIFFSRKWDTRQNVFYAWNWWNQSGNRNWYRRALSSDTVSQKYVTAMIRKSIFARGSFWIRGNFQHLTLLFVWHHFMSVSDTIFVWLSVVSTFLRPCLSHILCLIYCNPMPTFLMSRERLRSLLIYTRSSLRETESFSPVSSRRLPWARGGWRWGVPFPP